MGAAAISGLAITGQIAQANKSLAVTNSSTVEYKATTRRKEAKQNITVNDVTGGLDMSMPVRDFGLTPKEYGMRYGSGGTKRSNRLRYSHNAKVKRRKSA